MRWCSLDSAREYSEAEGGGEAAVCGASEAGDEDEPCLRDVLLEDIERDATYRVVAGRAWAALANIFLVAVRESRDSRDHHNGVLLILWSSAPIVY